MVNVFKNSVYSVSSFSPGRCHITTGWSALGVGAFWSGHSGRGCLASVLSRLGVVWPVSSNYLTWKLGTAGSPQPNIEVYVGIFFLICVYASWGGVNHL